MKNKKILIYITLIMVIVTPSILLSSMKNPRIESDIRFTLPVSLSNYNTSTDSTRIILYVENISCSTCMVKIIDKITQVTMDKTKPLLIVKPDRELNKDETNDFYDAFGNDYNLEIITNDSIRILNKWIPDNLYYYGFLKDTTGIINHVDFIGNDSFISAIQRQISSLSPINI